MLFALQDIAGVDERYESAWRVKALSLADERLPNAFKSPALSCLANWARCAPGDYKAIIKVLRIAGSTNPRVTNEKHVKKGAKYPHIYEARAHTLKARLMFFYDEEESTIICLNGYEKESGNQTQAFRRADDLRNLYLQLKNRP